MKYGASSELVEGRLVVRQTHHERLDYPTFLSYEVLGLEYGLDPY